MLGRLAGRRRAAPHGAADAFAHRRGPRARVCAVDLRLEAWRGQREPGRCGAMAVPQQHNLLGAPIKACGACPARGARARCQGLGVVASRAQLSCGAAVQTCAPLSEPYASPLASSQGAFWHRRPPRARADRPLSPRALLVGFDADGVHTAAARSCGHSPRARACDRPLAHVALPASAATSRRGPRPRPRALRARRCGRGLR